MSLGQFMRLLAPLLWSWLADSGGQRVRIVVASTAASLASFSVVFLTEDFVGLLLGLSILHFFWSASLPLVEALTLGHLARTPEHYGRIRLWGSVGFILTVMGVGLLLDAAPIKSQLWVSWALLLGRNLDQCPDPDRGQGRWPPCRRADSRRACASARCYLPDGFGHADDGRPRQRSTCSTPSTW
jgi:MFS family permease